MTRGPWLSGTSGDVLLGAAVLAVQIGLGVAPFGSGREPDVLGWVLLALAAVPLGARRRKPLLVLAVILAVGIPYHALGYIHPAAVPSSAVAIYTVASAGPRLRSLLVGLATCAIVVTLVLLENGQEGFEMLHASGWIFAAVAFGDAVRVHRSYIAAIVDRAERAERTREEEAARRVAEERLRIARDLHDLLAHSITLIGVQASVAAHVLVEDPERLNRDALAGTFETISGACRDARSELRATLTVLRQGEPESKEPLPGLPGIQGLADGVAATGLTVSVTVPGRHSVPPAVGAAAHRIVQEALTNVVKHARARRADVKIAEDEGELVITVVDDGRGTGREPGRGHVGKSPGDGPTTGTGGGFGILGMSERARSVGGTLEVGPRPGGGFAVTATLPLGAGR